MSNNRDLLKEAIADAKAVKETAIANAKAALEEAFTPHLKSMLAAKLEEMDKDEDIDEGYDKYEEDDVKEEVSEEVEAVEENEEVTEAEEVEEAKKEEIDEEEINLDELLAELNETEEVTESEEIEEAKEEIDEAKDDKEEVKESDEIEESEEVTEAEEDEAEEDEAEEGEGEMEEEEIDLEDMSEDDLKGFIEDVIKDMVQAGELEAGEEMEVDGEEPEMDMDIEVEDEAEMPMMEEKEELEEMDEVSWNEKNNPTRGASKKELDPKKVGKSTSAYAVNLEEVMSEVNDLKQELQEVNLLNAKLLYTNKIFKSKNLSEDKKVKVLKAFDKAETVKEAKVIFETLNEGMISKVETKARPKGQASKVTAPLTEAKKQPIVENAAFARMQRLAGIIKEN
jgi:hypothetical protein